MFKKRDANKELIYINKIKPSIIEALKKAYPKSEIKSTLLKKKWPSSLIDKAISLAEKDLNRQLKLKKFYTSILYWLGLIIALSSFAFSKYFTILLIVGIALMIISVPINIVLLRRKSKKISIQQPKEPTIIKHEIKPLVEKKESFFKRLFKKQDKIKTIKKLPQIKPKVKESFFKKLFKKKPKPIPQLQPQEKISKTITPFMKIDTKPSAYIDIGKLEKKPEIKQKKPIKKLVFLILLIIILAASLFYKQLYYQDMPKLIIYIICFLIIIVVISIISTRKRIEFVKKEKESVSAMKKEMPLSLEYETDFDKVYKLLLQHKRLKISAIAKAFNVKNDIAEKWAEILEKHGLAKIHYPPLGSPELVLPELKKEVE